SWPEPSADHDRQESDHEPRPAHHPHQRLLRLHAFYDVHRPAYHAYAAAHLSPEEAQLAVSHLFNLVADNWTTVVCERHPAAWAWGKHTRTVAHRSGRVLIAVEDAFLLHDQLLLSIDQIATMTGTELAAVSALLAAAHRTVRTGTSRPRPRTAMATSTTSNGRHQAGTRAASPAPHPLRRPTRRAPSCPHPEGNPP
ncbi:hypothetical protein ABZY02_36045, partial [Streptomyces sp. NPDC006649]|uniref:hypothetical protein n=1 Tax=Streptomyces sp. NPDC006649 TaxID=3156896 RepID=UPI0033A0A121